MDFNIDNQPKPNQNKNMEIATCEVRLLGDLANSVPKSGVTPAEAAVLKAIHGDDAVVRVALTGNDRRSHQEEYNRLVEIYGNTVNNEGNKVFFKIFPQSFDTRLPVEFKQVGITVAGGPEFPPVADLPDVEDVPDKDAEFFEAEVEKSSKNKK